MGAIENGKDTTWKGALRRALDNAASDLDRIYEDLLAPYDVDPYVLRDEYLPAVFTGKSPEEFIAEMLPKMKIATTYIAVTPDVVMSDLLKTSKNSELDTCSCRVVLGAPG